jgi:hypothetical protein
VHVRGKGGRQVPILLQPSEITAINVLVSTRIEVGVAAQNPYVFAAPTRGSLKPVRGCRCFLTVLKNLPELRRPELVRSTKLRKYVATVAQIGALTDGEMEWLAEHLGHSVTVHKEFYRLHDSAIELAKVSRLLMTVDAGKGTTIVGKSLSQIQMDGMFFQYIYFLVYVCVNVLRTRCRLSVYKSIIPTELSCSGKCWLLLNPRTKFKRVL